MQRILYINLSGLSYEEYILIYSYLTEGKQIIQYQYKVHVENCFTIYLLSTDKILI